jgi:hypothetical protein
MFVSIFLNIITDLFKMGNELQREVRSWEDNLKAKITCYMILSRVCTVTINVFWFEDRIYWAVRYSA